MFCCRMLILASIVTGCAASAAPAELGTPLTLRIGEDAELERGLTVSVDELLEDSRCPADVQCIQAGRVRLAVTLAARTSADPKPGEIALPSEAPFVALGYTVALTEVQPPKLAPGPLDPARYQATLVVARQAE